MYMNWNAEKWNKVMYLLLRVYLWQYLQFVCRFKDNEGKSYNNELDLDLNDTIIIWAGDKAKLAKILF